MRRPDARLVAASSALALILGFFRRRTPRDAFGKPGVVRKDLPRQAGAGADGSPSRNVTSVFPPLFSVTDQGLAAAVGLLTSVFVGRTMGRAGLGVYAVTSAVVLTLNSIQNGLVLQGLAVLGARTAPAERASYFASVFWYDRASSLLVAALFSGGVLILTSFGRWEESLVAALHAAMVYTVIVSLQNLFRRQLYLEHRPLGALLQSSIFITFAMLGFLALHHYWRPTVARVYLVLAASSLAVCLLQASRWKGHYRWPGRERARVHIRQLWEFGRWILVTTPFVIGTYQAYYFLVGLFLSPEHAGLLKAADVLVLPLEQVLIGLTLLYTPTMAERIPSMDISAQREWVRRMFTRCLALGVAYGLALVAFRGILVSSIFGEDLSSASSILPILALLPIFHAAAVPVNVVVMSLQRPDLNLVSRVIATFATLTAGVLLIRKFGLEGAAFGLVISVGLFAGVLWLGLLRHWHLAAKGAERFRIS